MQPHAGELRGIRRVRATAAGKEGFLGLGSRVDHQRLHGPVFRREIGLQVAPVRRSLRHADGCILEVSKGFDTHSVRDQEPLAVVEKDPRKLDFQHHLTSEGPGGVAQQQVDPARLQRGEAGRGDQRHELDLVRITQDRRRHRAAEVHVESTPMFVGITLGKT